MSLSEYTLGHSPANQHGNCLYNASVILCLVFRPDPEPDDVAAARHEVEAELQARQVGSLQVDRGRHTICNIQYIIIYHTYYTIYNR